MRIFYAFVILFTVSILFMLPFSEAVYSYRTDIKQDNFTAITPAGTTNVSVTLTHNIFNNDTSTLSVMSGTYLDSPFLYSHNVTTRKAIFTGLADNTTRTLSVFYDIDAINNSSIDLLVDKLHWLWLLMIVAFIPASIVAIFIGR